MKINKKKYEFFEGQEVVPCIYDEAERFECAQAFVVLNNMNGFIDLDGKEISIDQELVKKLTEEYEN